MTRVLVVHHDLDLAGQEVDSLRRFGYEVTECSGPTRNVCPVLAGHPCDLAERADVLVYDVWASGDSDGSQTLIDNIRELHPDTPVVLTSPGLNLSWEEATGPHAVTMVVGQPTGARLHEAIQAAVAGAPAESPTEPAGA
jgi:DNA-binding NtrC family response regulator